MHDAEDRPVELGQERHFPVVVELRQPCRNRVGEPTDRGEEPESQILVVHMRGQVVQHGLVLRPQRPHAEHRPIAQPLDSFELLRIGRNRQA
jgi:hypothetical protein